MKNLIIGSTSQLNYFFPHDWDRISSRNINFKEIKNKNYNSIFILFAEQRTFINKDENFFNEINVTYTLKVINELKSFCKKIIIYSTSELWNNYDGQVSLDLPFNYFYTPYIKSKEILCTIINENKKDYSNIHIVYPFNFNSPFRKNGFLFSKIFDCIINKKKISVGNLDLLRDIIHPSIIVNNSIDISDDIMIGSGQLINIKNFVSDLMRLSNMEYCDYIIEEKEKNFNKRNNYYSKNSYSNYNDLLNLTNYDIQNN
jgi:nucleoside-diphosphate-sugar epimerase